MARHSCCSSASVLGGMNSNENAWRPTASRSRISGWCGSRDWPEARLGVAPAVRRGRGGLGGIGPAYRGALGGRPPWLTLPLLERHGLSPPVHFGGPVLG